MRTTNEQRWVGYTGSGFTRAVAGAAVLSVLGALTGFAITARKAEVPLKQPILETR